MSDESEEKRQETEKKRNFVIMEVISTEKTYLSRLKAVIDVYIEPLGQQGILTAGEIREQFGFWKVIYGVHEKLYDELVKNKENGTLQTGKTFSLYLNFFKVYKDYLVEFEKALSRRGVLMTSNKKFVQFVETAQKDPRCCGLTLESLLIEPVQRIPRYRMLLEQLQKYTVESHEDYAAISSALVKICDVAQDNNEAIKLREKMEGMMQIMMQFSQYSFIRVNLMDEPSRRFLRSDLMSKQCRREVKEFQFWLFTDKLLYGELIPGQNYYILHREILLQSCRIGETPPGVDHSELAFTIQSPKKSFVVWTKTPEEKEAWQREFCIAKEELTAKKKLEMSDGDDAESAAPIWNPNTTSNTCENCNVAFSVFVRRHHCRNCSRRKILAHIDASKPQRVCESCFGPSEEQRPTAASTASAPQQAGSMSKWARRISTKIMGGSGKSASSDSSDSLPPSPRADESSSSVDKSRAPIFGKRTSVMDDIAASAEEARASGLFDRDVEEADYDTDESDDGIENTSPSFLATVAKSFLGVASSIGGGGGSPDKEGGAGAEVSEPAASLPYDSDGSHIDFVEDEAGDAEDHSRPHSLMILREVSVDGADKLAASAAALLVAEDTQTMGDFSESPPSSPPPPPPVPSNSATQHESPPPPPSTPAPGHPPDMAAPQQESSSPQPLDSTSQQQPSPPPAPASEQSDPDSTARVSEVRVMDDETTAGPSETGGPPLVTAEAPPAQAPAAIPPVPPPKPTKAPSKPPSPPSPPPPPPPPSLDSTTSSSSDSSTEPL